MLPLVVIFELRHFTLNRVQLGNNHAPELAGSESLCFFGSQLCSPVTTAECQGT